MRGGKGEELEVWIDGTLSERIAGEKDFSSVTPPLSFRLNSTEAHETFSASTEALDALSAFLHDDGSAPPWDYASELLSEGLIDVHFALTPRGRRALASHDERSANRGGRAMAVRSETLDQIELDLDTAHGNFVEGFLDPTVSQDTKMLAAAIALAGSEIAIAIVGAGAGAARIA